jgi:hypothetical protein
MPKSPVLALYLASFKEAAGEGAALELKLRLLAGKVPALRKYAHQQYLRNIEDELATHFGDALSADEKEMLPPSLYRLGVKTTRHNSGNGRPPLAQAFPPRGLAPPPCA